MPRDSVVRGVQKPISSHREGGKSSSSAYQYPRAFPFPPFSLPRRNIAISRVTASHLAVGLGAADLPALARRNQVLGSAAGAPYRLSGGHCTMTCGRVPRAALVTCPTWNAARHLPAWEPHLCSSVRVAGVVVAHRGSMWTTCSRPRRSGSLILMRCGDWLVIVSRARICLLLHWHRPPWSGARNPLAGDLFPQPM